jgi:hypothetical protein
MPTIKDYSIIETEWLEELKSMYLKHNKECEQDSPNEFHSNCGKIFLIEMLQSKLKPLIPIIKKAIDFGGNIPEYEEEPLNQMFKRYDKLVKGYINNTIIE